MIYTEFDVVRVFQEGIPRDLSNVLAVCLLDSQDPAGAARQARYKIEQSGWKIIRDRCAPVNVTLADFENRDWGTTAFNQANEQGMAIVFVAVQYFFCKIFQGI